MSYELCVFRPEYAPERDTAHAVWNDEKYWATSLPESDRAATKWRVMDLLTAFDSSLQWVEPKAAKTGLFAKWFSKPVSIRHCLHAYLDDNYGGTAFDVFDQAIEITLPWESPRDEAGKHVRTVWRYLEHLSASGWSTIYDTERGELLDLAKDMDAVTARYLENLGSDDADESSPGSGASTGKPAPKASPKGDKLFTGNVD